MKKIVVVGAGFSGSVVAHQLAQAGRKVEVYESRSHVAGNCHTERDRSTGVMVHVYGPHIFHTNNDTVWNFIRRFDEFMPFTNRVKAVTGSRVYSLPINLLTINQFFDKTFNPSEAEAFLKTISVRNDSPKNFEEQALSFVGKEIYEAFFQTYTLKQWGTEPSNLPASILKRLPLRFNYDDNYYSSKYQGMPRRGYTHIVENLLDHPNIKLYLNTRFPKENVCDCDHIFYTGPLDSWFSFDLGRLGYRTLDFVSEHHKGDYQGNPVINYCDSSVPWTRISEHKHFSPWETHEMTVIFKEYSRECEPSDIPYYPIRLASEMSLLQEYVKRAVREMRVTFLGRLGTYRYLDMHITIAEALETADRFLASSQSNPMPAFLSNPLQP